MGEIEDVVRSNQLEAASRAKEQAETRRQQRIKELEIVKVHATVQAEMIREIVVRLLKELKDVNYPDAELLVFDKTWFTRGQQFACWILPPVGNMRYRSVLRRDGRFFTRQDYWWRSGVRMEIMPDVDYSWGKLLLRALQEWHHSRNISRGVIKEFYAAGRFDSELIREFGLYDPNSVN